MATLNTTCTPLAGGAAAVDGAGKIYRFTFGGSWDTGDRWAVDAIQALTAEAETWGNGALTGERPAGVFTFKDKVYVLIGSTLFFSALTEPHRFNDLQRAGAGFIAMANHFGTGEPLVALASYQGRLAVISRRTTQIWAVDPDPANYEQTQVLTNCGTAAPHSVASVGDMDVYFLADSGVRSIRVRDASNNAVLADIGSPIDPILQPLLARMTDAQIAMARAVVEPTSNRYWVWAPLGEAGPGRIWVFSYFPGSEIAAWSSYIPTAGAPVEPDEPGFDGDGILTVSDLVADRLYAIDYGNATHVEGEIGGTVTGGATPLAVFGPPNTAWTGALRRAFMPDNICVLNGRVYLRSGDDVYLYGGPANASYDRCGVRADTPFLNAKTPATRKSFTGVDAAFDGQWTVSLGVKLSDPDALKPIYAHNDSSFLRGLAMAARQGTHFKLRLSENGDGPALFSSAVIHFQENDAK
jgi:hypothetical protein